MGQALRISDLRSNSYHRVHEYEIAGIGVFKVLELPHSQIAALIEKYKDDEGKLGIAMICECLEFPDGKIDIDGADEIFANIPPAAFDELSRVILDVQKVGAGGLDTARAGFRSGNDEP